LTFFPHDGHNQGMWSQGLETARKPLQFSLGSIFLATSATAVAFGLVYWFGPEVAILVVQSAVIVAVAKRKRTAWMSSVILGLFVAFPTLFSGHRRLADWLVLVVFWVSLPGLIALGRATDGGPKLRCRSLRWSWLLPYVWFLIVLVVGMIIFADD
jgi:hypothetical protein